MAFDIHEGVYMRVSCSKENLFWTLDRASPGQMLQGHNTQGGDQIKVESEEIKRDFRNRMQY